MGTLKEYDDFIMLTNMIIPYFWIQLQSCSNEQISTLVISIFQNFVWGFKKTGILILRVRNATLSTLALEVFEWLS